MDKKSFLGIVRSFGSESVQDAHDLDQLKSEFPYSQILHILSAKITQDLHLPSQQEFLQHAAVYSTDRSVLKDIMLEPVVRENQSLASVANVPQPVLTPEQRVDATVDSVISKFDVAETVMNDLKRLNELKSNFELLFADQSTMSLPTNNVSESRIKAIDELTREIAPTEVNTAVPAPSRRRKKDSQPDHSILEEIKTSKEEMALESERQKQQIELIDQFIKAQPSISTNIVKEKPVGVPPTDLNSIKSGEFGENIISETLVEILLKQGKKERAIEVLKKLIWKYPQKKAYFASRIEDLKK